MPRIRKPFLMDRACCKPQTTRQASTRPSTSMTGAAMWLWDPHGMIAVSVIAGMLLVMLGVKAVRQR